MDACRSKTVETRNDSDIMRLKRQRIEGFGVLPSNSQNIRTTSEKMGSPLDAGLYRNSKDGSDRVCLHLEEATVKANILLLSSVSACSRPCTFSGLLTAFVGIPSASMHFPIAHNGY
jgi:hypothetical protein